MVTGDYGIIPVIIRLHVLTDNFHGTTLLDDVETNRYARGFSVDESKLVSDRFPGEGYDGLCN